MPGWLIAVFIALVFLVIVAALILLLQRTDSTEVEADRPRMRHAVPPAELPQKPRATFRRKPPPTFRRKLNKPAARILFEQHTQFPPPVISNNGGKMEKRMIKVNLDAVCRLTGRSIRVCGCVKCQEERTRSGA